MLRCMWREALIKRNGWDASWGIVVVVAIASDTTVLGVKAVAACYKAALYALKRVEPTILAAPRHRPPHAIRGELIGPPVHSGSTRLVRMR